MQEAGGNQIRAAEWWAINPQHLAPKLVEHS